uniref:Uncharacterized protein n=1 Tax=Echinococcus canadensis TaxID=519352 RepID=A0A915EXL9_9CEST
MNVLGTYSSPGKPQVCSSIISHRLVITASGDVDRSTMIFACSSSCYSPVLHPSHFAVCTHKDTTVLIIPVFFKDLALFTSAPLITVIIIIHPFHKFTFRVSSFASFLQQSPQLISPSAWTPSMGQTMALRISPSRQTLKSILPVMYSWGTSHQLLFPSRRAVSPTNDKETIIHEGHSILENAWVNEACNNGGSRAFQKRMCAKCNGARKRDKSVAESGSMHACLHKEQEKGWLQGRTMG